MGGAHAPIGQMTICLLSWEYERASLERVRVQSQVPGMLERGRAVWGTHHDHPARPARGSPWSGKARYSEIASQQLGAKRANRERHRKPRHVCIVGSCGIEIGASLLPRLLLDTHVLIRWLVEARKLSRIQLRTLESAVRRGEPIAFSAISLLEIAVLASGEKPAFQVPLNEFLQDLNSNPVLRVLPLTFEVALEVASLGVLRDPADRAIVATARVHRLRLVTSDQRVIQSNLVQVVE